METYFNSHTYDEVCRINRDPENQYPLMPQNIIIIIVNYNFGIYYNLNLFVSRAKSCIIILTVIK
jgi:hypothetical protein